MSEKQVKLLVASCSYRVARYAVMTWHYSRAMPSSSLIKYGVWENKEFIGAVIFGRGACKHLLTRYGLKNTEGCELVRVALKEHKTPVTRILSIALKILKKTNPGLKLVVSFADSGQGHIGGIYQGGNWIYAGSTGIQKFPEVNGQIVHPRTFRESVKAGRLKKNQARWIETAAKHRYLYPLDNEIRYQIENLREPYPKKRPTGEKVSRPAVQQGVGGAVPTVGLMSA